jgi:peroxiredoxin
MAQLRQDYDRIQAQGAVVVAVSPDSPQAVKAYWEAERLPFIGIADPAHSIAGAFGQRSSLLRLGRLPALVVIDRGGVIGKVHHGESMADIPSTDTLIGWLRELNVVAQAAQA